MSVIWGKSTFLVSFIHFWKGMRPKICPFFHCFSFHLLGPLSSWISPWTMPQPSIAFWLLTGIRLSVNFFRIFLFPVFKKFEAQHRYIDSLPTNIMDFGYTCEGGGSFSYSEYPLEIMIVRIYSLFSDAEVIPAVNSRLNLMWLQSCRIIYSANRFELTVLITVSFKIVPPKKCYTTECESSLIAEQTLYCLEYLKCL